MAKVMRHEDQDEGQVGHRRQGGRRKEVAHHLDLPQVVRVGAGRIGPLLHAQAQRLAEQHRAHDEVGLAPGHVDQVGPQLPRQQVEQQGQQPRRWPATTA
jgi:hypothetical protein